MVRVCLDNCFNRITSMWTTGLLQSQMKTHLHINIPLVTQDIFVVPPTCDTKLQVSSSLTFTLHLSIPSARRSSRVAGNQPVDTKLILTSFSLCSLIKPTRSEN
ncbi:hypothetical protein Y1Q_0012644 [Alligator mississippiensis]|uniref:Uncharacterized protein n=1 Tax=Alligator mississippiensis TaxID=8496 RepID=A0A151M8E3_ALLMI|nr:hypothetical protein Y1Q_0012644 [Alligator mississippiensis]